VNEPPRKANARRQPGERISKLTDEAKLGTRVRHVKVSPREAGLCAQKARRALREFAKTITEARTVFEADRSMKTWLALYEAKHAAYSELVTALPQIAEIEDFWRYVQNMPVVKWVPIIEAEVQHIMPGRTLCEDCGAVEVSWPTRRCAQCQEARRRETYRNAKQRKRTKERIRQCQVCQVEPLGPYQKVCASCQTKHRQERNQRYQKSLKERNLRRVQPDSTKEKSSTVSASGVSGYPVQNVELEAVLTLGTGFTAATGSLRKAERPEGPTLKATQ
jgi:hypothetical protein